MNNPPAVGQLVALVPLLDQPVALTDLAGRIIVCNAPFAAQQDTSPDDLVDTLLSVLCPELTDQALKDLVRNRQGRGSWPMPVSGAEHGATLSVTPVDLSQASRGFLVQLQSLTNHDIGRLRFLENDLEQAFWEYDVPADCYTLSAAWRHLRGRPARYQPAQRQEHWLAEVHPDDQSRLSQALDRMMRGETPELRLAYRALHSDGHYIWILCRGRITERDANGIPQKIVGTDVDITELKEQERALQELRDKMEIALNASGIGIWDFDPATGRESWDDRMLEIYGLTADEKKNKYPHAWEVFLHPDDKAEVMAYADAQLLTNSDFNRDYRILRKDGQVRHIRSIARASRAAATRGRLIGVNIDVTEDYARAAELEAARRRLEHDARHDALTGLPNRRYLDDTVLQLMSDMDTHSRLAVMHIDLDEFKTVNDLLGHAAGDKVLCTAADRLRDVAERAHLVSRSGGDEFVILSQLDPDPREYRQIASDIVAVMADPVSLGGHRLNVGASVGLAFEQGRPSRAAGVFLNADRALYAAKAAGRGQVVVHGAELA